jgi:hypothetical protein
MSVTVCSDLASVHLQSTAGYIITITTHVTASQKCITSICMLARCNMTLYSIRATRAAAAMLTKPAAAVAALLGALGVAMVSLAAGASLDLASVALPAGTSAGSSPGAAALAVALASVAVELGR